MASRREDAIEEPLLSPGFTSYVARPIDETLVRHALPPPAPLPHSAPRALTSPPPSHHPAHFPQDPLEPSSRLGSSSSISTPRRRYHLGDGSPYEFRAGRDAKKPPSFSRRLVRPATHPPPFSRRTSFASLRYFQTLSRRLSRARPLLPSTPFPSSFASVSRSPCPITNGWVSGCSPSSSAFRFRSRPRISCLVASARASIATLGNFDVRLSFSSPPGRSTPRSTSGTYSCSLSCRIA